jgi:hypothetical protein
MKPWLCLTLLGWVLACLLLYDVVLAVHTAASDSGCDYRNSLRLFANLFSGTLSRQSLLHSTFFAGLQVEGVTLHFLNDVFGYNLALETAQGVLQRLAFLQPNFCQTHPPKARMKW